MKLQEKVLAAYSIIRNFTYLNLTASLLCSRFYYMSCTDVWQSICTVEVLHKVQKCSFGTRTFPKIYPLFYSFIPPAFSVILQNYPVILKISSVKYLLIIYYTQK